MGHHSILLKEKQRGSNKAGNAGTSRAAAASGSKSGADATTDLILYSYPTPRIQELITNYIQFKLPTPQLEEVEPDEQKK
jgi:prephenate dehydrogenase